MAVEERFRDGKDGRYGLALGHTLVKTTARLDRLVLILALAIVLLTVLDGSPGAGSGRGRGATATTGRVQ